MIVIQLVTLLPLGPAGTQEGAVGPAAEGGEAGPRGGGHHG